jgi:glycosyltransferase involved in cell wall biosynthesis
VRILHLDEQRGWRGGEQQASYLIRGLAERGHYVALAGRRNAPFLTRDHGAPIAATLALPFVGEWDLWTALRLAQAVRSHRIDILHAHTSHTLTLACLARRLAGRGKVVASRRVDFVPRATAFNRWKYRQPDRIVAISACIADVMRDFGIDSDRLRVVRSAVDASRFDVTALSRSELGLADDTPVLLNVAALVGHKDQATLIAAMRMVPADHPDAVLLIAGEGALRLDLERQVNALGLGDSVRFLGYRDDVPRLLRMADVFVLSSSQEGLGTSVLDAMAADLPVVATAAGGIPEMVIHEETGLLSPPKDPAALARNIHRMLDEFGLRQRCIENAARSVREEFGVSAMVEGNLAVYRELVAGD